MPFNYEDVRVKMFDFNQMLSSTLKFQPITNCLCDFNLLNPCYFNHLCVYTCVYMHMYTYVFLLTSV